MKQGANISWSKGIDIVHSLFSYHWGFMLEIHMKRYLKIARTFSSVVPHSFLNQEQHGTDSRECWAFGLKMEVEESL